MVAPCLCVGGWSNANKNVVKLGAWLGTRHTSGVVLREQDFRNIVAHVLVWAEH